MGAQKNIGGNFMKKQYFEPSMELKEVNFVDTMSASGYVGGDDVMGAPENWGGFIGG